MKRIILLLISLSTLLVLGAPSLAYAQSSTSAAKTAACDGISQLNSGGSTSCDTKAAGKDVTTLVHDALNIFSIVVGIAAVIMIIIGGFKYITSGGDSTRVSSAKDTILYAIIGLVIAALAQVIVRFVLSKVKG